MENQIALTNFEVVLPGIMMNQQEVLEYTANAHAQAQEKAGEDSTRVANLMKRYGVKPTQIAQRGFENISIAVEGKDIQERTRYFGAKAREVMGKFYQNSKYSVESQNTLESQNAPDHLIHVTCTGYISPSPAQYLVNDKGWTDSTSVTHAYHMGCYAAIPAIRMAEGFYAAKNQRVDIVHTEMCGLHMDTSDHSPEQLVVQSLFADGHIKYSAESAKTAVHGFRVLNIREKIIPDSQGDMSWLPASWGMKMTLSRDVPSKIGASLRPFIQKLIEDSGYNLNEVLRDATFAIHPGGPKIIDSVSEILELSSEQVQASREVLLHRGNMSSATLPHVWKSLMDQKIQSGKLVVSLAFGPGLTIFGALFETI